MKYTYEQRLVAGLQHMGWVEDRSDRSKYRAFISPGQPEARKVFVGRAGALRAGRNASNSMSNGDPSNQTSIYRMILKHGDNALAVERLAPKPIQLSGNLTGGNLGGTQNAEM